MLVTHLYRSPGLAPAQLRSALAHAREALPTFEKLETEVCFNVGLRRPLTEDELAVLRWLLAETFEPDGFSDSPFLDPSRGVVLEVGPRMAFTTAFSTNAVSICHACGLAPVIRIERSRRYLLQSEQPPPEGAVRNFLGSIHDRMTEQPYPEPLKHFDPEAEPRPVREVPLLAGGREALEQIDREMGLAFDDWDLDYYTRLFVDKLRRDPTDVELFDIAQSNSEHSRH